MTSQRRPLRWPSYRIYLTVTHTRAGAMHGHETEQPLTGHTSTVLGSRLSIHESIFSCKRWLTLNVALVILPHSLRIKEVLIGFPGSAQDSRVWAGQSRILQNPRLHLNEAELIWTDEATVTAPLLWAGIGREVSGHPEVQIYPLVGQSQGRTCNGIPQESISVSQGLPRQSIW